MKTAFSLGKLVTIITLSNLLASALVPGLLLAQDTPGMREILAAQYHALKMSEKQLQALRKTWALIGANCFKACRSDMTRRQSFRIPNFENLLDEELVKIVAREDSKEPLFTFRTREHLSCYTGEIRAAEPLLDVVYPTSKFKSLRAELKDSKDFQEKFRRLVSRRLGNFAQLSRGALSRAIKEVGSQLAKEFNEKQKEVTLFTALAQHHVPCRQSLAAREISTFAEAKLESIKPLLAEALAKVQALDPKFSVDLPSNIAPLEIKLLGKAGLDIKFDKRFEKDPLLANRGPRGSDATINVSGGGESDGGGGSSVAGDDVTTMGLGNAQQVSQSEEAPPLNIEEFLRNLNSQQSDGGVPTESALNAIPNSATALEIFAGVAAQGDKKKFQDIIKDSTKIETELKDNQKIEDRLLTAYSTAVSEGKIKPASDSDERGPSYTNSTSGDESPSSEGPATGSSRQDKRDKIDGGSFSESLSF